MSGGRGDAAPRTGDHDKRVSDPEVEFDTVGSWPTPPCQIRRALSGAPLWLLSTARSNASITIIGAEGELSVHVLVDGDTEQVPVPALPEVDQRILLDGEMIWAEARWLI